MLLATIVFALPVSADQPVERPTKIGELPRFPADAAKKVGLKTLKTTENTGPSGSAVISHKLDRIYQLWNISQPRMVVVAERDLATLELGRVIKIPGRNLARALNSSSSVEFVVTLDDERGRLFMEYGEFGIPVGEGPQRVSEALEFGLLMVDLKTMRFTDNPFPAAIVRASYKANVVFGIEYDEKQDMLLVLTVGFDENFQLANVVSIIGWPGKEFDDGGLLTNMSGPRVLRTCRRDAIAYISSIRLTPIMIADGPDLAVPGADKPVKNWVVIPCLNLPFSVNNVLLRVERSTLFDHRGSEQAIPAPSGIANWFMDTAHGRLHLLNQTQETDDWVYEVSSNAFIGIIELSAKGAARSRGVGLGIDEQSGRLYGFGLHKNEAGTKLVPSLMIAQAAQDPVPQANVYEDEGVYDADSTILVDGKRDRIFVVRRTDPFYDKNGPDYWDDKYIVYKVPPKLSGSDEIDPDSLTKQVDEQEGKTIAEWGGSASAYGARVLLASGFAGIVPNNGNDTVGQLIADANSQCGLRSREIVLGGRSEAELGNSLRDAAAYALFLDEGSRLDFGQPSRCDLYYQYLGPVPRYDGEIAGVPFKVSNITDVVFFTGLLRRLDREVPQAGPWEERFNDSLRPHTEYEYKPAECTSKDQADEPGHNSNIFRGDTRVECTKPNEIEAFANAKAEGVLGTAADPLPIRVGRATSWTKVYLDPKLGLVSEAVARLENVAVGEIVIGFIENRAKSFAKGRTGTAKTEIYEPKIGLVRGPGFTSCSVRCNIDELIPQLNNALSGRGEFRRINPDPDLQEGSEGGYQAGIIKSDKQKASDNSLVGDKSSEVPALELIVYNDNSKIGRARQVVQFAGVRADSHYGIQVFDEGSECLDCEPEPVDIPPPSVGGTQYVEVPGPTRTRTERVPGPVRFAIPGGYRLLLANPRAAATMATVWLLLAAPFIVAARRGRLKGLQ